VNSDFLDLYRKMESGDTLLNHMIDLYLQEAPAAIQTLRSAVNEDDPVALSQAAHKFKSSNMQLGADQMASLCTQLDKLGQLGTTTGGWVLLAEMEDELLQVKSALQDQRQQPVRASLEQA
jgi:HPt (histidine-containing phosphotransfer) domain-containing protein